MKSIEVKWFKSGYSLSEISQGSGFLFSFVSAPRDGSMQIHQHVKCRDFLQDAIRSHITGNVSSIYGFSYVKGTNPPIDMRRTRLLVTKTDAGSQNIDSLKYEMKCGLKVVNYFENIMGLKPTKMYKVSNAGDPTWIFNGNGMWMKSPALISLYTLLIRLGYQRIEIDTYKNFSKKVNKQYKEGGSHTDRDPDYIAEIGNKMIVIAKHYKEIFSIKPGKLGSSYDPIYRETMSIDKFHDRSGILGLCNGKNLDIIKASGKLFALLEQEQTVSV